MKVSLCSIDLMAYVSFLFWMQDLVECDSFMFGIFVQFLVLLLFKLPVKILLHVLLSSRFLIEHSLEFQKLFQIQQSILIDITLVKELICPLYELILSFFRKILRSFLSSEIRLVLVDLMILHLNFILTVPIIWRSPDLILISHW